MLSIGLISDVHATPEPLAEALRIFSKAGVDQVLCAGDIAGYMKDLRPTIELLIEHDCMSILGNHDQLYIDQNGDEYSEELDYLQSLPSIYEDVVAGKRLYMVHAQPPHGLHGGIKLLDREGDLISDSITQWSERLHSFEHDILIVGHTHQVYAEYLADTLVINPGSTVFNHCCAILHLPEMRVEWIALSGNRIRNTWNWGDQVIRTS